MPDHACDRGAAVQRLGLPEPVAEGVAQLKGLLQAGSLQPGSRRSALYGVLAEIEALGLDLLEVRQLAPQRESPESGDSRSL